MFSLIVNSGLWSPALWIAIAAAFWLITTRPRWVTPRLLWAGFFLLSTCSLLAILSGLYRAYSVPRDVMQDIVAAQEYLAGRPIEPPHMNVKMRQAIDAEGPRYSLLWWSANLSGQEARQRDAMLNEHWVQAHPPFVTLCTAQLVRFFGVLGTQIVYAIINIASILAILSLCYWKFRLYRWKIPGLVALVGILGWSSVVCGVRLQQLSLPIAAILAIAWVLQRRGFQGWAGVCIGLTVCLKLIPGVMLLPLLARYRRGFTAASATIGVITALVVLNIPWSDLVEYRATTAEVVEEYAAYTANISLLGMYARCLLSLGGTVPMAKAMWVASIGIIGLAWAWVLFHHPKPGETRRKVTDAEWSFGLSLIPLLSPVAWDHYQVFLLLPMLMLANQVRIDGSVRHRVVLACIIVVLALPDSIFLTLSELLTNAHLKLLNVWLVLPLRTLMNLTITGWTGYLLWQKTSDVRALHPVPCELNGPSPRFLPSKVQ